jgi:hypothetical protein
MIVHKDVKEMQIPNNKHQKLKKLEVRRFQLSFGLNPGSQHYAYLSGMTYGEGLDPGSHSAALLGRNNER